MKSTTLQLGLAESSTFCWILYDSNYYLSGSCFLYNRVFATFVKATSPPEELLRKCGPDSAVQLLRLGQVWHFGAHGSMLLHVKFVYLLYDFSPDMLSMWSLSCQVIRAARSPHMLESMKITMLQQNWSAKALAAKFANECFILKRAFGDMQAFFDRRRQ